MKKNVFDLDGKVKETVELPSVFDEDVREDIIRRASLALQSHTYQPKGNMPLAGLQTTAAFFGRRHDYRETNSKGISRLPRIKDPKGRLGEVRRVPQSRGGRRAHGPKVEKILEEKINKKERIKATRSALAATAKKEIVEKRGHKVKDIEVPLIIVDDFSAVKKTKDVKEILKKLHLEDEMQRGEKKSMRAGKGGSRGRKYRRKKSLLVVVANDKGVLKAARNIPGIDACLAKDVSADMLAPGGDAGRITLYTKSALAELEKRLK